MRKLCTYHGDVHCLLSSVRIVSQAAINDTVLEIEVKKVFVRAVGIIQDGRTSFGEMRKEVVFNLVAMHYSLAFALLNEFRVIAQVFEK